MRGLEHPFAVTIEGNLVFWTDWFYNSVDAGHKIFNAGIFVVREGLRVRPYGIEAVTPTRQANGTCVAIVSQAILLIPVEHESGPQLARICTLSPRTGDSNRIHD